MSVGPVIATTGAPATAAVRTDEGAVIVGRSDGSVEMIGETEQDLATLAGAIESISLSSDGKAFAVIAGRQIGKKAIRK